MPELIRSIKDKPIIVAAGILIIAALAAIILFAFNNSDSESLVTEDVPTVTIDLSQSVTAAGQVVTAEEENIYFSTSKVFRAMCVEENERVSEGQHLILYSDGTYEDAPADGFVTSINAPSTGYYASSSNYITFAYADKLMIDITVPEGEINEVAVGNDAEIIVNSDTSKVFTGKILRKKAISTTLLGTSTQNEPGGGSGSGQSPFGSDSSTAYYTVSLAFDNDGTILPGMSAVCTITISEKKGVTAVPIEAVRFDEEGNSYVLVVSDSGTEEAPVTVGDSDADYVEITEGLEEGTSVRIERKG